MFYSNRQTLSYSETWGISIKKKKNFKNLNSDIQNSDYMC